MDNRKGSQQQEESNCDEATDFGTREIKTVVSRLVTNEFVNVQIVVVIFVFSHDSSGSIKHFGNWPIARSQNFSENHGLRRRRPPSKLSAASYLNIHVHRQ